MPAEPLKGKTALVTGAGKRLGKAIALALGEAGANVVVHYGSSKGPAQEVVATLEKMGVQSCAVQADLSLPDQAEILLEKAPERVGPIDILVNNASVYPENELAELSVGDLNQNVNLNALAPFLIGRALAAKDREAVIVNMLDTRITCFDAKHATYHVSKRLLFDLTKMMAVAFAPKMRVNAVAPGLILPPAGKDASYLEELRNSNPLQQIGNPGDIVKAVLYLLNMPFVTGQVLYVDGGYHLKGNPYGGT